MADAPNTSTYTLVVPDTSNLPNSRTLSSDNGIVLEDSGVGNNLNINTYGNLNQLFKFDKHGFVTYNSTSSVFNGVSFTGGQTINITHPDGTDGNPVFSVIPDSSRQRVTAEVGGVEVSTRSKLNFISGSNISVSVTDNFVNGSADITITGSGIPGEGTVTSVGATTSSSGLTITGSPITSSGNINLELSGSLNALSSLVGSGFIVEEEPGIYVNRQLTSDDDPNMIIINGNGLVGDPIITISSTPTFSSVTIQNTPVNPLDGVNKQYADALIAGLDFKNPCKAVQSDNLTAVYNNGASGVGATLTNNGTFVTLIVDGAPLSLNTRILVTGQTSAFENGIYKVTDLGSLSTPWILTRSTDYDTPSEIQPGNIIPILDGDTYGGSSWIQLATVTTIGTSDLIFFPFTFNPIKFLQVANNLSDLNSVSTARTNLSIPTTIVSSISTGTGLTGGPITDTGTISIDNTAVSAGSYTSANITVNAQGQITAASNGGGGGGTVTSVGATTISSGLLITGSPITSSGNINIELGIPLNNLSTSFYKDYGVSGANLGNLFLGTSCGSSSLTTSVGNTGIGINCLSSISTTTGGENSGFGYNCLKLLTSGNSNTSVGWESGKNMLTGNNNCFFGLQSGTNNVTTNQNSGFGTLTFINLTGGTGHNSAFGVAAGSLQTSYTHCTFLGGDSDASVNGLTNATAVGWGALVGTDNTIVLGNTSVTDVETSGKITISTASGSTGLDLATADSYANLRIITNQTGSLDGHIYLGFNGQPISSIYLYSNSTQVIRVENGSNIGINGASYGGGGGVIFIGNTILNPTSNPTGGGILYCDAGALKYRGPSGLVTIIALG